MAFARARALRTLQSSLRHSGRRAVPRASAPSRTQLVQRRYQSGGGESHGEHSQGSDIPWALGAVVVTIPSCWYLWPDTSHAEHTAHASSDPVTVYVEFAKEEKKQQEEADKKAEEGGEEEESEGGESGGEESGGGESGGEESEDQAKPESDQEQKEAETKDKEETESNEKSKEGSGESKEQSSGESKEEDSSESKDQGSGESKEQGSEESKGKDSGESKEESSEQSEGESSGDSKEQSGESDSGESKESNEQESKSESDNTKGKKQKHVESALGKPIREDNPTIADKERSKSSQFGISTGDTKHSTRIDQDPNKSKKAGGAPETSKEKGTVGLPNK